MVDILEGTQEGRRSRDPETHVIEDHEGLIHKTVSSRAARTPANPLFPVNYLDREIRKDLHEHVRETACFGRNVNAQMERLTLYLFYHNYRNRHRAHGDRHSNAEMAGLDPGEMSVGTEASLAAACMAFPHGLDRERVGNLDAASEDPATEATRVPSAVYRSLMRDVGSIAAGHCSFQQSWSH